MRSQDRYLVSYEVVEMMEFYLCRGAEKNVEMECEIPETWIDWVAHRSEQVSIHCGPLVDSNVEKELNVKETKPLLNELTSLLASSYNVENILTSLHAGELLRIKRFVTVSSTRPSNGSSHVIKLFSNQKPGTHSRKAANARWRPLGCARLILKPPFIYKLTF